MAKHIFALYKQHLSELIASVRCGDVLRFKDATLWNRLVTILRIKPQEKFILFDENNQVELIANETMLTEKRVVACTITSKKSNLAFQPSITLLIPLLKKDALEYVTYVAAQMGVQSIIPVVTKKSDQTIKEKEYDRLHKIIIAACEQSKNFIPPTLQELMELSKVSMEQDTCKLCFDEHGKPTIELVTRLEKIQAKKLLLTIGPEGGFTESEKKFLHHAGFNFYKLTPTILRSQEALTVGLGVVRSLTDAQQTSEP